MRQVLVVNKADLVSEAQLGSVEALVRRINPDAEVLRTARVARGRRVAP